MYNGRTQAPPIDEDDNLCLFVEPRNVSRIIGRGGSKIRELESSSGARIQVYKNMTNDAGDVRVSFSGSPAAQERAKNLVSQLLEEAQEQNQQMDRPQRQPYQPVAGSGGSCPAADQRPSRPEFNLQLALRLQAEGNRKRWENAVPIEKDFYNEHPDVTDLSELQVADIRERLDEIRVKTSGDDTRPCPNPVTSFLHAFHDYSEILSELESLGFSAPTPIQSQAWPVLLSGRDMIGIAQTGSGKTLAFLLPALIHTDRQPIPRKDRGGANVLVLSPTRELAQQTEREVKRFHYRGIRSVCVYGGGDRRAQVKQVCSGVEILIATPGRLNDLVQAGYIDVTSITYLVLDEADRMLDMGFEAEIRKVLLDIRPDRQTVMTSATWPVDVRRIADRYMNQPVHVVVGSLDLRACRTVHQQVIYCEDENEKQLKLDDYLFNMSEEEKIIVFFGRKSKASQLSIDYGVKGIELQSIHGDRAQEEREFAIEDMQNGDCRVLFATDVASRGIDIADVTLIINFDFPRHIEDYVHRIGRTGRAGKSGVAVTFMSRDDWRHAAELIEVLEKSGEEVPDFLADMADRFSRMKERRAAEGPPRGGRGRRGGSSRGRRGESSMYPGMF